MSYNKIKLLQAVAVIPTEKSTLINFTILDNEHNFHYPNKLSRELAYAIGFTLGCGTASYVV